MGKRIIKVANIIEEGRLGGPQIRIAEVAKALRQLANEEVQVDTTVIFPKYESKDFSRKLENYGVTQITLPLHKLARDWKKLFQCLLCFPFEVLILLRVLKENEFDIVHVSGGSWQVKGIIAGKFAGCRVLWHLNDTKTPAPIRIFFRLVASWGADGFIVAGQRVRKYYAEDLGIGKSKPVFEIQAPVDCSYFNPQSVSPEEKIAEIDTINIVSVGNVNFGKGFEYFMYMAELLNQRYRNLRFFIVGPHWTSQQVYSRRLEKIKVDKNLHNLTLFGPSSEVRRIHKAADIYVCSSIAEASPLSVWEAMAMQKPIVATDVGDISRFIKHGENGYIVSPADPEALAYCVGKLLENKELREQFGGKARQAALENLDISIAARKHLEAYQWAVGGRQKTEGGRQKTEESNFKIGKTDN